MRGKVSEWGGNVTHFNKLKKKEDKQAFLLEVWFKKFLQPEVCSQKKCDIAIKPVEKKAKVKAASGTKQEAIEDALNFKAEVNGEKIKETPEYLSKILILQEEWLEKLLDGSKTMELRKQIIDHSDTMYLAVKDTIYGKCLVSHPLQIASLEEFTQLQGVHGCVEPPYSFPFWGHRISKCQRLDPIQFKKLTSAIGRSLFRPLDWTPDFDKKDDDVKDEPVKAKPKGDKAPKKGVKKDHPEKPTGKSVKVGKQNKKTTDSLSARLPQGNLLEGQMVSVVNAEKHFEPKQDRLDRKREWLKRKDVTVHVNISGGALSHLNNYAFKSGAPTFTLGFLAGAVDGKGIVNVAGLWVPGVEKLDNIYLCSYSDEALQTFCEKHSMSVVGCVIVKPEGDTTMTQNDFAFACKHQRDCNGSFVTAITGKSRRSSFFRVTPEGLESTNPEAETSAFVQELAPGVHWTGPQSLYRAYVTPEELAKSKGIAEEAVKDLEKLRPDTRKKLRQRVPSSSTPESHTARVVASCRELADELGSVGEFLCQRIADFTEDNLQVREDFDECMQKFPRAQTELLKATSATCPANVASAGQLLSTVYSLKTAVEVRAAQRREIKNHSFDGVKYKKKMKKSPDDLKTPPAKRQRDTPDTTIPSSSTSPASSPLVLCDAADASGSPSASGSADASGSAPSAGDAESTFQDQLINGRVWLRRGKVHLDPQRKKKRSQTFWKMVLRTRQLQ